MEQRQDPGGDAPGRRCTEHGQGRDQEQVADAVGHRIHDGTERPRPAGAQRDRAVEPVQHPGEDDERRGDQRPPPALCGDDRRATGGGDPGHGERVGGDPRDRSRSEPLHPAQPQPHERGRPDAAVQGGPALLAGGGSPEGAVPGSVTGFGIAVPGLVGPGGPGSAPVGRRVPGHATSVTRRPDGDGVRIMPVKKIARIKLSPADVAR